MNPGSTEMENTNLDSHTAIKKANCHLLEKKAVASTTRF